VLAIWIQGEGSRKKMVKKTMVKPWELLYFVANKHLNIILKL